jgi:hypothetical protein
VNAARAIVGQRSWTNASVAMLPGQNVARAELQWLIDPTETVAICG